MSISIFFLILLTFSYNCFALNIGFTTSDGDKIIIGEFSRLASSSQIKKALEELEAHHSSYCTELHDTDVSYSITKLIKCYRTGINSFCRLFEIEMGQWLGYLQLNLENLETLSSLAIVFQNPLLITTRKTISNVSKVEFIEPIVLNLFDEICYKMDQIRFDDVDHGDINDEDLISADDPTKLKLKCNIKESSCAIL